jgi:predicted Mrr-cat superfamily restriction endonuclease
LILITAVDMQQAFILRIAPSNINRVPLALKEDQIIIGWSATEGLLDQSLSWKAFRKKLNDTHYSKEKNLRRAGAAAGHMWRFIRDMNMGDLVVVPSGPRFYLAEITSDALYLPEHVADDTCYRRNVRWLNNKKAIPRDFAKAALTSRMKVYGTTALATDVLADSRDALARAEAGNKPSFKTELQSAMIKDVVEHLRSGHIDSFAFEHLIKDLLIEMGAKTATVVPRLQDKGADILATFRVAETFQYTLAVQAKHWNDRAPVNAKVVDQLINGIEAANANLGMVVTSGTIAPSAITAAAQYAETTGIQIELVDGEQFAKLLIEQGIGRW